MNTETRPLGEIVEFRGGGTPSKSRPDFYESGSIPWVTPKDMKSWIIDSSIDQITEQAVAHSAAKLIPTSSVLVVIRSGVLKHTLPVGINLVPVTVNQDMKALVCSKEVDPFYLGRFLRASARSLLTNVRGTTADNISAVVLKDLPLPLPPLAEQKRIAGVLDAADALRAKRRASLAQLDTLLQSTFLDLFGDPVTNPMRWKVGRLADVVERLDGGKNIAQSETEADYRVLKVSAVTSGVYRPDESKYLPAEFDVPASYIVKPGDLLISRANTVELIGATAYVWETPENIALPDKIWKFIWKRDAEIEPLFIYHLSQDAEFRRILGSRASGTSGSMKNITKPKLLGLPIPRPPLDVQRRFTAIVESVERQKARLRTHLAELDALFASLQSRAFNGEL